MKLSIDLEHITGDHENGDTLADLLREVIKNEVTAIVRAEVRKQMKSKESEVKKMVSEVANRDWRQLATMLLELKDNRNGK